MRASLAGEAPPDVDESSAATWPISPDVLHDKLSNPCQGRPYYIRYAFKLGWTVDEVHDLTGIDPWFLDQMAQLVEFEDALGTPRAELTAEQGDESDMHLTDTGRQLICKAKQWGYSNVQLANALDLTLAEMGKLVEQVAHPTFRLVDTCAAEYEAHTPYCYSTHEPRLTAITDTDAGPTDEDELKLSDRGHVVVLGGGPNRIGQGLEFDYCCGHAAMTTREMGFAAVMVNSNPETVSTDFGTSDVLFFEPLVHEDVLRIVQRISREDKLHGVIVQFGGQTPLNLARGLKDAGVPIFGTPPEFYPGRRYALPWAGMFEPLRGYACLLRFHASFGSMLVFGSMPPFGATPPGVSSLVSDLARLSRGPGSTG